MAYAILGTPKPAFFDSSGAPLASGTLTIQDPDTSSAKDTYPTAVDADATTNGVSTAYTLDSRGEVATQLWGRDGEDYKVILKDSAGSTIYTIDEIRLPPKSRRATVTFTASDATPTIAESSFFINADGTTITDYDDGQVGDIIHLLNNTSDQVITHADNSIALQGSVDFYMRTGDKLTLAMFQDQVWTEIGRTYASGNFETVTATNTIVEGENGATYFLDSATEFVSTLPAPAAGLHYTFIVKAAPSGANYTVVTNSSANIMHVYILDIVGEMTYAASQDVVTFVDGGVAGDKLEVFSDGTNWFCYGLCGVDGKMTSGQT